MAGRPQSRFEVNLNAIEASVEEIIELCTSESSLLKLKSFVYELNIRLVNKSDKEVETDIADIANIPTIQFLIGQLAQNEKFNLIEKIFLNFVENDKLDLLKLLYDGLETESQCQYFFMMGKLFNQFLLKESENSNVKNMNFDELANETKSQFYEKCDIRLKAFFAAATLKSNKYQKHHDNINELANIYENLLKARNFRYTSPVGVRDNIIAYIGSDKSNQTTQVLCKAGAKGSKPILEQILQNTEDKKKFEALKT